MRTIIPRKVDLEEILVRSIFHSLHISLSKKTLKREAFLPPPGRKDVSVLRLDYTCADACKNHSLKINMGGQTYQGLALVQVKNILSTNSQTYKITGGGSIKVSVVGTPLNETLQLIEEDPVYTDTPGVPMHGDIFYSHQNEDGEPQTILRLMANAILPHSKYFKDPVPKEEGWAGEKLELKSSL
jgi:hypothetical protein